MTSAMTCTDCLRVVATADVAELTTAAAVTEHCRGCPDCATLVREVAEESRRLADMLDGTLPGVPAHVVALEAVAGSGRVRRRGRALRVTASVVGVLLATLVGGRLVGGRAAPVETRTVELQCLDPEQIVEVARPQLPPGVAVTAHPAVRLPVLTLRGSPRDLAAAEQTIARLDARWAAERPAYCANFPAGRAVPTPTAIPGH
ncbi:hypothetical protein [Roseisolibacter agri]|nr:hypothetical protein [Roseisolibacter agri]